MITEQHARMYRLMAEHIDSVGGILSGLGEYGLANIMWSRATVLASCARDHVAYVPTQRWGNLDADGASEEEK